MTPQHLESQEPVAGIQTRTMDDVALPTAGPATVRVRTLVYDKGDRGREAWLARCFRPALGPQAPDVRIFIGRQCHGTTVRNADEDTPVPADGRSEFPDCDGLFTRQPHTVLAVRTADCVPIVVSDAARPWIGVVHAGWRGTIGAILSHLIDRAMGHGSRPGDLHLWIGPHIHACHYEVSEPLSLRFQQAFPERQVLRPDGHLSLLESNIAQALRAGIPEANIRASTLCTFEEQNRLPSYRRDGQCRGEIVTTAVILPGS